jgi:hypothetical protein
MSGLKSGKVYLSRRARRDLDEIRDDEVRIIWDDIKRLLAKSFPGEIKMIPSLPGRPLQADTGRYRILFRRQEDDLEIITVFPRKDQGKVFRSLR